jgi:hypothetical protein
MMRYDVTRGATRPVLVLVQEAAAYEITRPTLHRAAVNMDHILFRDGASNALGVFLFPPTFPVAAMVSADGSLGP